MTQLLVVFTAAHLPERRAAVRGAADVHQDGAAAARRRARRVVGGDGVLPGRAARRLRLRASADALRARPPLGDDPSRRDGGRVLLAAAVDRRELGPSARGRRSVLAARPVRGLDRAAVLRARRQCAAAAGLVRAHRSSVRERSLFPVCRQQYRQLPRAAVVSDPDRAVHHAQPRRPGCGRRASSS